MADHGILIKSKMAAKDVDAFVRPAKYTSDIDNGNVVQLSTGYSTVTGEGEVWLATVVATGTGLQNLWMVSEDDITTTSAKYRGIDVDVRNRYVASGDVFTAVKPKLGDIIKLSEDAIAGTKSTNGFVVATNATVELTWAAAAVSGLTLKLLETSFISIPDGTIGTQRSTVAYIFEVTAVA